jgi:hypothetical protein
MNSASRDNNQGRLRLRHDPGSPSGEAAPACRDVALHASPNGKTLVLVEFEERFSDQHATGPEQEVRHEISVSELIQLIRAHGARF